MDSDFRFGRISAINCKAFVIIKFRFRGLSFDNAQAIGSEAQARRDGERSRTISPRSFKIRLTLVEAIRKDVRAFLIRSR